MKFELNDLTPLLDLLAQPAGSWSENGRQRCVAAWSRRGASRARRRAASGDIEPARRSGLGKRPSVRERLSFPALARSLGERSAAGAACRRAEHPHAAVQPLRRRLVAVPGA